MQACLSVCQDKIHIYQSWAICAQCKIVRNSPNCASWHCKALSLSWHTDPVVNWIREKKSWFLLSVESLNNVVRNLDKSSRIWTKPWNKHVSSWEKHSNKRLVVHCNPILIFNSITSFLTQNSQDLTNFSARLNAWNVKMLISSLPV